jgi:hypothetical protein
VSRARPVLAAIRAVAAPLAIIAFWGGMAAAAHVYPAGYDWQYQTISVLLYPDQNPHGYLWAWAGLELCGLAGVAWTAEQSRRLQLAIPRSRATGFRLLLLGFVCMCCAVLPDRLLPLPKGHELFAILAFLGLCVGVTWQMSLLVDSRKSSRRPGSPSRIRSITRRVMPLVPVVPLVLAASTQAYLALLRPTLPWVGPSWRTLGISPFLSFGLWEWTSCAALSVCLLVLWHSSHQLRCAQSAIDA